MPDKTWKARPKIPGLWVRLTLVDGSQVDGVISEDLRKLAPWSCITIQRRSDLAGKYPYPIGNIGQFEPATYQRSDITAAIVLGAIGQRNKQRVAKEKAR